MAILKLSKNGNSLLMIDERGFCYTVSAKVVQWAITGRNKEPLILTMLPNRYPVGKFAQSRLFVNGESMPVGDALDKGLVDRSFFETVDWKFEVGKDSKKGKPVSAVKDFVL